MGDPAPSSPSGTPFCPASSSSPVTFSLSAFYLILKWTALHSTSMVRWDGLFSSVQPEKDQWWRETWPDQPDDVPHPGSKQQLSWLICLSDWPAALYPESINKSRITPIFTILSSLPSVWSRKVTVIPNSELTTELMLSSTSRRTVWLNQRV